MNILGKRVVLRGIEKEDLPFLHRWSHDPEVQQNLGGWHFPHSIAISEAWLSKVQSDQLNLRFSIQTERHGLIGTANLVEINWKDRNAFHGMLIGDKDIRGQGYGVDTVMALMRYAFEELGLERLDGSMIEYNEASLKLYLGRCGWKEEGVKKNAYWRKNRFWDKIIVGVTRADYASLVEKSRYWD
jgi:RimJ/RimL family protein N-acetyltransferase